MFESQQQDEIHAYVNTNPEFRRLYQRHRELDAAVLDAELGVRPIDDMTLVAMKKEKLHAKDRLTYIWEHRG
jgi:uncharacterized protein